MRGRTSSLSGRRALGLSLSLRLSLLLLSVTGFAALVGLYRLRAGRALAWLLPGLPGLPGLFG